jgi:hypothetical protein
MPIKKKGEKILRAAGYKNFKKHISRAVAQYIRENPEVGRGLHKVVEETLENGEFKNFFNNLTQKTKEITELPKEEARESASILVSEEISKEIKEKVPELITPINGEPEHPSRQKIYRKLSLKGILKGKYLERVIGPKTLLRRTLGRFFRKRPIFIMLFGIGAALIVISGILLGSVYNALIVGLTLDVIPTESIAGKIGNIVGGLGGIIIFFNSITLGVIYFLEKERRREQIRELADEYLKKTK